MQAAPWNLKTPARSFLIREQELMPGESEATTLLGQCQELQEQAASVSSRWPPQGVLAFDVSQYV